jgi:catechol 2,3-dioxygenase-like lactoylglutathione lyase family enzyme
MKQSIFILSFMLLTLAAQSNYFPAAGHLDIKLYGVKLRVNNLEVALKFYHEILGFQVDQSHKADNEIQLSTNSYKIILHRDVNMKIPKNKSLLSISMCMAVQNIDSTFQLLKSKGVRFLSYDKRKEGVGYSMKIFDPFGNCISIMQLTYLNAPQIVEPFVYNCGFYVTSLDKARYFYSDILGFTALSEKYLPDDLPMGYADKKLAFMLHQNRPEFTHLLMPNMKLVFTVPDFIELRKLLIANKIAFTEIDAKITITDNNGIDSDIIQIKIQ